MNLFERLKGSGGKTYLVAEMSANHGGNLKVALQTMNAAKEAGADAFKVQTYSAETMTLESTREEFTISGDSLWKGRALYDLYEEASMPWEWHRPLKQEAEKLDMDYFSTAFDATAVDFLEELGVQVHKVASFEIVDLPLIRYMAETGKPLIISTGLSTRSEIADAVACARTYGSGEIILLKCTSAYPAPSSEMNLRTIPHLAGTFYTPVGLSDHTLGTTVPVTAVALGACMIEKHFILSREVGGPDSSFSLQPQEFRQMAEAIREVEAALGSENYGPTPSERNSLIFRRSLFVVEPVKKGEGFSTRNVKAIRPGHGLAPKYQEGVLGRKAIQDIAAGTPLSWDLIEGVEYESGAISIDKDSP